MHLRRFKFSTFSLFGGACPQTPLAGWGQRSHVSHWAATNRILAKSLATMVRSAVVDEYEYFIGKEYSGDLVPAT